MPITKYNSIFGIENFNKIYKKTKLDGVFYIKLKSPISVQFELTAGCNQKCIFCYNVWKEGCSSIGRKRLSKEQQIKILNQIVDNEIFDIIFSGGEPLLVSWLPELIKMTSNKKINTSIITNGKLLTKEKVKSLKDSGLNSMQISLHHFNPDINDRLTGQKGSFQKTVEGIKNALEIFNKESINVNMVTVPETYKDVYKMAEFLKSLGVFSFSVATPTATGEMKKNKDLVINKKMFLDIYDQLISVKKNLNMNVGFTGGFPMCILPKIDLESLNMIGNYCDAGLNQLVIDPEGNIKPCVCLNQKLGNILNDDLKEIWKKHKFLKDIRKLKYLPEECAVCKYLSLCRGGCRASAFGYFGKLNAKDPLME